MHNETKEVFANTCGKIYKSRLVLATSSKESVFPFYDIKSITFKKGYEASGLLFACLPGMLAIFPFVFVNESVGIKLTLAIIGVAGMLISLFKTKRKYSIHLEKMNGRKMKIKVWHGNKNEAEKFVSKANSLIIKAKSAVPETAYNTAKAVLS